MDTVIVPTNSLVVRANALLGVCGTVLTASMMLKFVTPLLRCGIAMLFRVPCSSLNLNLCCPAPTQTIFRRAHREHDGFAWSHYGKLQNMSLCDVNAKPTFFFCMRQPSQPRPDGTPGIIEEGRSPSKKYNFDKHPTRVRYYVSLLINCLRYITSKSVSEATLKEV